MKHMLKAVVVVPTLIVIFIVSYAVLADPIHLILDVLIDAHPETGAEIEPTIIALEYFFGGAVVIGILLILAWLFVWSHKYEHEQD